MLGPWMALTGRCGRVVGGARERTASSIWNAATLPNHVAVTGNDPESYVSKKFRVV